jgi:hypothetical protein
VNPRTSDALHSLQGRIQLRQGAHQDEIAKRALKDPVETGFVAVHQIEVRLGGGRSEGAGETAQLVLTGGLGGDCVIRFRYMHERAIYMVNSFQFTRSARRSLVYQSRKDLHAFLCVFASWREIQTSFELASMMERGCLDVFGGASLFSWWPASRLPRR